SRPDACGPHTRAETTSQHLKPDTRHPTPDSYSVRNATTASMRVVDWAGTRLASAATPTRSPVTTVSVARSVGVTSYRSVTRSRFASRAPHTPSTDPTPAIVRPRLMTIPRRAPAVAPSAIRTPSSRVRWRTMVAIAPNSPTVARVTAAPANTA